MKRLVAPVCVAHRTFTRSRRLFCVGVACAGTLLSPLAALLHADDTWTGGGTTANWSDAGNWSNGTPDVAPYGSLIFSSATNSPSNDDIASLSENRLLMSITTANSASGFTINGTGAISLYDNSGTQAKIENNAGTGNTSGVFTINNATTSFAATAGAAWGEINAVTGGVTFGTANTLNVTGSQVAGIRLFGAGNTTTFNNTVNASGKYFATTAAGDIVTVGGTFASGDIYVMNNGVLNLAAGGVINNDANTGVRLGGDFSTTGTQNLAQSGIFNLTSATGGTTFAGVVNSVANNTSAALAVNSNNTSGTNVLSGHLALDSALKITQAASGALNITQSRSGTSTTTGTDIKAQTLTLTPAALGLINISGDVYSSTGAGSLILNGAGVVTLSGNNTFSGGTTASAGGTLNVNSAAALGTGALVLGGNYTIDNTSGSAIALTSANPLTLSGGSLTFTGTATGTTHDLTFGALTLSGATRTITVTGAGSTLTVGSVSDAAAGRQLVKAGAGTLALSSAAVANNFTGGVALNAGTLAAGNDTALGTGTLVFGGGTLTSIGGARTLANAFTNQNATSGIGGTNNITFNGTYTNLGSGGFAVSNTGLTTFAGPVILRDTGTAQRTLTLSSTGSVTFSGNVSPGTSLNAILTFSGSGVYTLSGNNTYNGNTSVAAGGTIKLGSSTALGFGAPSAVNGNTTVASGAVLDFNGQTGIVEPITINGTGINGGGALINSTTGTMATNSSGVATVAVGTAGAGYTDGTYQLTFSGGGGTGATGTATFSGGVLISTQITNPGSGYTSNPTVTIAYTGAATPTTTATTSDAISAVALGSASSIGGAGNLTLNAPVTGGFALTKVGAGTVTLASTNTYTGATTVNAGTMLINGSTVAGSAFTVNNSGTVLGGSGTIGGSVTANTGTTVAPGATGGTSTAILTTGAFILAGTYSVDLQGPTAGTNYDQIKTTGAVTLTNSTLTLNSVASSSLTVGQKFFILLNGSTTADTGIFTGYGQGTTYTDSNGDTFTVSYTDNGDSGTLGNDVSLTVNSIGGAAVPEPATWVAGGLLVGLTGFRLRRRLAGARA